MNINDNPEKDPLHIPNDERDQDEGNMNNGTIGGADGFKSSNASSQGKEGGAEENKGSGNRENPGEEKTSN